jgi:hypothetical protein
MTITSTINQCQILNEPILLSSILQHGWKGIRATQDMEVEMIHLLPTHPSGVDDGPEALLAALIPGKEGAHCAAPCTG